MIKNSYSFITKEITQEQIWALIKDVNQWKNWDTKLENSELIESFSPGNHFVIRPKGGPNVKIQLVEVREKSYFKDLTKFPFAKMYGEHFYENTSEGLKITITMSISGPLAFLWNKIVMKDIVTHLPEDVKTQIHEAKKIK
ncbi:MAG: SRPBCC family protein [Leptospira sp.]|nr:SRPBCC family protein [Leptospira sp.]